MRIGYARVSTGAQSMELQLQALNAAECVRIYQEQASGASRARPVLDHALDVVRAGDQLVVYRLDRLGRSVRHLLELADVLQQKQVDLVSLTESLDTSTPQGRLFFTIASAFAECERTLIVERGRDGMAAAKAAGKHVGRPPALTDRQIKVARKLVDDGAKMADVARDLGVSRWTIARALGPART